MFDFLDSNNIIIHKYGPHAFHTNSKKIVDFLKKFSDWQKFNITSKTLIDNCFVDYPFNFNFINIFFPKEESIIIKNLKKKFKNKRYISIFNLLKLKDFYFIKISNFLYTKNYIPYAQKQWNNHPNNLNKSILKRNPIFLTYKSKYFNDKYQLLPKDGYTKFFESLINHKNIELKLSEDIKDYIVFKKNSIKLKNIEEDIILYYTGSLDYLFDYKFGRLSYRSIRFKYEKSDKFNYTYPIIYYPQTEKFTRVTIYNNFYNYKEKLNLNSIVKEFPIEFSDGNRELEPYYPVRDKKSLAIYKKYVNYSKKYKNLFFVGRLANYQYYNMDQIIQVTFDFIKKNIKEF